MLTSQLISHTLSVEPKFVLKVLAVLTPICFVFVMYALHMAVTSWKVGQ